MSPVVRSTRSKNSTPSKVRGATAKTPLKKRKKREAPSSEEHTPEVESDGVSDAYQDDPADEDLQSLDSDALDDDSDVDAALSTRKRKHASLAKKSKTASPKKAPPRKRRRKGESETEEGEENDSELELKEGQEIVGVVVQAPKTGRVPPGQISHNTLDFLTQLKDPECNDREWFKLHEPVYRLAEKEWKDFIEEFTNILTEVDPQIPPLPPKDVIHRIYRDIRFSNDKTPYKQGFSASFSRSGRKGIFAAFKPGGENLIAAGSWCPGRNELQTIRSHILHSSRRLRALISAPSFVKYFGEPIPGSRQNIFGRDDELKVAPKGIEKNHKDIDLLKCRSFAVLHKFTDEQVLAPDFKEELAKVARIVQPFVHLLNDMMTLPTGSNDSDGDDNVGSEEDD